MCWPSLGIEAPGGGDSSTDSSAISICAFSFLIMKINPPTPGGTRGRPRRLLTLMSHTPPASTAPWWKRWWRRLPPSRQDRFATLGPLLAALLYLAAIVVAIADQRFEEIDREREAVTRDVEHAQQRLRLRLLERQEQLMRLAREIDNQ